MDSDEEQSNTAFTPLYQSTGRMYGVPAFQPGKDYHLGIVGILYDLAVSNRPGTRFGPRAIREASGMCAWSQPYGWGFDPLTKLSLFDYGDIVPDYGMQKNTFQEIHTQIKSLLDVVPATLALGGDHFISYPILRAYADKYGDNISLIQFDSHTDTWEDGTHNRIDHGSMFLHSINDKLINPDKSVQVGIRTHNDNTRGMNIIDAPSIHKNGLSNTVGKIREIVGDNPVYLTFDIDFLDPAYAPGTGTPVCGGFSTYDAITLLQGLSGLNIIGMDIVEVSPPYDHANITALAAATIAMELMCLRAQVI